MINFTTILQDIRTFADDDSDVTYDNRDGTIVYERGGELNELKVVINDHGQYMIEKDAGIIPYKQFLSKDLGRLDLLANRIIEKKKAPTIFIKSEAKVLKYDGANEEKAALSALIDECKSIPIIGTKVCFLTADAGHGKTHLLSHLQRVQAENFAQGLDNFLIWHIDLQGRELVRLNEAIMYDLAELRVSGLYYNSILTLLRHGLIKLAIDGFDELAAEVGGRRALGSITHLVNQMNGRGVLIAASRRTFFDTQDYIKRNRILESSIGGDCVFNEIKLKNWTNSEVEQLFEEKGIEDAESLYYRLASSLENGETHPLLTRPFLVSKLTDLLNGTKESIDDFIQVLSKPGGSISSIISAFIKREVIKWKDRDTETGEPYLTYEQHLELLTEYAVYMRELDQDWIPLEVVTSITDLKCEEWGIDSFKLKNIITNVSQSHAFLIPFESSGYNARKFEHEEFFRYFLSNRLSEHFVALSESNILPQVVNEFIKFVKPKQLNISVAQYAIASIRKNLLNKKVLINNVCLAMEKSRPGSYIKINLGIILPFLAALDHPDIVDIGYSIYYSSNIFEDKEIVNTCFGDSEFVNISFRNTSFHNCIIYNSNLNIINLHDPHSDKFSGLVIRNSSIKGVHILSNDIMTDSAFSPTRIAQVLSRYGIKLEKDEVEVDQQLSIVREKNESVEIAYWFLLKFNKQTLVYEKNILEDGYYATRRNALMNELIPIMERFKILKQVENSGTKQANSKAYALAYSLEQIFENDSVLNEGNSGISEFWNTLYNMA